MKICIAASEAAPLAKTGGLADVATALTRHLGAQGHDARLFLPFYSTIDPGDGEFTPVSFVRDVGFPFAGRMLRFSLWTGRMPGADGAVYLVDCPELFHRSGIYTAGSDEPLRFAFFTRAVLESCQRMGWGPDVFHINDWHTGLLPLYLRTVYAWDALFRQSRTLLTIHNIAYQGLFPRRVLDAIGLAEHADLLWREDLEAGHFSFLKTGIQYADVLSTVSPTHAAEICTPDYGMGLDPLLRERADRLVGILNGVDYRDWDPSTDTHLPHRYSVDDLSGKRRTRDDVLARVGLAPAPVAPVLGIVSRLVGQKGFELLFDVLPLAMRHHDLRLLALGSGEEKYERFFTTLAREFPDRVFFYRGYHDELAHVIEAAADVFLMPSLYEPCGLNQMYSLRYGTPPLVRYTGGLADSVEPWDGSSGTGFVFRRFTADSFARALQQALAAFAERAGWRRLVENGMRRDFSWERQSAEYVRLYRRLLAG
ncbi:MAG: glycogen synthase [Acidobacteriota bacterium]|nr:glycogen synthase [Acidobacteriota bacterium]